MSGGDWVLPAVGVGEGEGLLRRPAYVLRLTLVAANTAAPRRVETAWERQTILECGSGIVDQVLK